jgi:hypothetical protein
MCNYAGEAVCGNSQIIRIENYEHSHIGNYSNHIHSNCRPPHANRVCVYDEDNDGHRPGPDQNGELCTIYEATGDSDTTGEPCDGWEEPGGYYPPGCNPYYGVPVHITVPNPDYIGHGCCILFGNLVSWCTEEADINTHFVDYVEPVFRCEGTDDIGPLTPTCDPTQLWGDCSQGGNYDGLCTEPHTPTTHTCATYLYDYHPSTFEHVPGLENSCGHWTFPYGGSWVDGQLTQYGDWESWGCNINGACNYDSDATEYDGSCVFPVTCSDGYCISPQDATEDDCSESNWVSNTVLACDQYVGDCPSSGTFPVISALELDYGNNLVSIPLQEVQHLDYMGNFTTRDFIDYITYGTTCQINFILGQGVGLFMDPDNPGEYVGNLSTLEATSGYWINITGCGTPEGAPYFELDLHGTEIVETYQFDYGNNLISWPGYLCEDGTTGDGCGSKPTLEAFPDSMLSSMDFILGQGLGLFDISTDPTGNLTNMYPGKGYWVNVARNMSATFNYETNMFEEI